MQPSERTTDTTTDATKMPATDIELTASPTRPGISPLFDVLVMSWITPARAAKRLVDLPLSRAFFAHVMVALGTLVFIATLDALGRHPVHKTVGSLQTGLANYLDPLVTNPGKTLLITSAVVAGIELSFASLSLVVMPWGARDERLRDSFRHALRQTWLRTAHIFIIVLTAGSVIATFQQAHYEWWQTVFLDPPRYPTPPPLPSVSPDQVAYMRALDEYVKANQAYSRKLKELQQQYQASRRVRPPWYVGEPELINVPLGAVMLVWLAWALLRAVGIERRGVPIEQPPLCEHCGYNLTTMPMDARCPECGRAIIESIGPGVRPGSPWALGRTAHVRHPWWTTTVTAIRTPRDFGARLPLSARETAHRSFLASALPAVFLTGALGFLTFIGIDTHNQAFDELPLLLTVMSVLGMACALAMIAFALKVAMIVGLILSWSYERNMLPGAMRAASYLAGYLMGWALFGAATGIGLLLLDNAHVFERLEEITGIYRDMIAVMTWLVPNGACGIGYIAAVARTTSAMRYANT